MKLRIGENIKSLRKARDITQEALAEMLGVSCQSVSRWELGTCYPDMELLPAIAEIFQSSVDSLLGLDDKAEKEKVQEYLGRFQSAISKGHIQKCIAIAREGVAEYPNHYALLNKLMYALFVSGDDSGNIPEWKENREKYDGEIIALGERILKYCPDQDIRLEATARLAFQHMEMGRKDMGRSIYGTLPSKDSCRENHIWWALEEEEKLPFIRSQIREDYESLRNFIWLLGSSGCVSDQESLVALEKVFELERLICDGKLPPDSWDTARLRFESARLQGRLAQRQAMYEDLTAAAQAARAFDERPESHRYESVLLGTIEEKALDFETADSRPLREIMREKWLSDTAFHAYREEADFLSILAFLQ